MKHNWLLLLQLAVISDSVLGMQDINCKTYTSANHTSIVKLAETRCNQFKTINASNIDDKYSELKHLFKKLTNNIAHAKAKNADLISQVAKYRRENVYLQERSREKTEEEIQNDLFFDLAKSIDDIKLYHVPSSAEKKKEELKKLNDKSSRVKDRLHKVKSNLFKKNNKKQLLTDELQQKKEKTKQIRQTIRKLKERAFDLDESATTLSKQINISKQRNSEATQRLKQKQQENNSLNFNIVHIKGILQ